MENWTSLEIPVRIGVFAGVFLLMAALETAFPRKIRVQTRPPRWFASFGMLILANLTNRFIIPATAISVALFAQKQGIGLFNALDWPVWLEITAAIILLDLAIWAQHLIMHHVPVLWAVHRVHHADQDLDAASGIRFHPLEQSLSLAFKMLIVVMLGTDPLAVFLFEVILNASAMFNHASIRLPLWVDKWLRTVIVTPDFHRVHHSVHMAETNSNYGFCLSIWDRLFRTYTAQPRDGHDAMRIGLDRRPAGNTASLWWCLIAPFRKSDQPPNL